MTHAAHIEVLQDRREQLEALVRALRHDDPSDSVRSAHRRRQAAIIAALAIVATLIFGGSLPAVVGSPTMPPRATFGDANELLRADVAADRPIRVYARLDARNAAYDAGGNRWMPPPLCVIADRLRPEVAYTAAEGLAAELRQASEEQGGRSLEIVGFVDGERKCQDPLAGFDDVGHRWSEPSKPITYRCWGFDDERLNAWVAAHARRNHIAPERVRVVTVLRIVTVLPVPPEEHVPPHRARAASASPVAIPAALVFLFALALAGHHRRVRRPIERATREDFETRPAGRMFVLTLLSLQIYGLYWSCAMTARLRRLTARPDLLPGIDVFLTIASAGLWSVWVHYRNAEAIAEAMRALDSKPNFRPRIVLLLAPLNLFFGLGQALTLLQLERATRVLVRAQRGQAR